MYKSRYDRYDFYPAGDTTLDDLINERVFVCEQKSYIRGMLMGAYLVKQALLDQVDPDSDLHHNVRAKAERMIREKVENEFGMDYKEFQNDLTEEAQDRRERAMYANSRSHFLCEDDIE